MALVHLNFESLYLNGNTDINVILPDRERSKSPSEFYGNGKKYKVLWLLHGTFGDYTDWIRKSNVELYACERNLIVVMPSGLNADYANWPGFGLGYNMYDYLTEELMPLIYNWFPASDKKEDNYIAGLSMGGFGTCIYALNHPEKFAAASAMSGCPMDMGADDENPARGMFEHRKVNQLQNTGGLEAYLDGVQNTWRLAKEKANDPQLPRLYFSCGTKDALLYDSYVKFQKYAEEIGLEATFEETEGYAHEWRFWDLSLQKSLEFFGLTDNNEGNAF
ncbi:alpha/beta hydrolase [Scatolibacter rhodanostii]|uniref:alpha/beta hydrolase n=1 Tax=Scatolibacter rhodanostii TaxID=2014781 RepID=UPI000C07A654|nr:alpha/beta hydrolase family protein [Scatolibacter rhodanostii]